MYDVYTCYCVPSDANCEPCNRQKTCYKKWKWECKVAKQTKTTRNTDRVIPIEGA